MNLADLGYTPEVIAQLADPIWRLRNMYYIVDRDANVIPFRPNEAQDKLLKDLHNRNIILKARQRGFSTLIQLAALDQSIFNDNYTAGIIADNLDNAAVFLKRIVFAYDNLPPAIRNACPIASKNASVLELVNGSRITVDTSFRSGTLQFLHISEFGKICAKAPDKAKEIKTGTIPALAPGGIGFIESTAEGHEGEFHDMCMTAQGKDELGTKLNAIDWKFHFYSWWDEDQYRMPVEDLYPPLSRAEQDYCVATELAIGRKLEGERWAWYWATRRGMGDDMFQEYPSTPEEAFHHSIEGRYYSNQFKAMREQKRIGFYPHLPDRPVYTLWDIGQGDETAIWFFQYVGSRIRFVHYYENSGESFDHFIKEMQKLQYTWGVHYLPHDATHKRQLGVVNKSAQEMLEELTPGWRWEIVDRIPDITVGINQTRQFFAICEFDETACKVGLKQLEVYHKEWNIRTGAWKAQPFHGPESNGADAYRQGGQLYANGLLRAPAPMRDSIRSRNRNWRVA